jgi:glycosyltransferase involved in cell wall biosynthesis
MPARKVIHLNDKIDSAGGAEVYLEQLQSPLAEFGWESDWLGVTRNGDCVKALRYGNPAWSWDGTIEDFKAFLASELGAGGRGLLHVHSISDPGLIRACFGVAPVVRTMHEPRMFCPGQQKFWSRSEIPCPKPFGAHCLWHAYTEKCCNRHPKRLLGAMRNAHFEITEASHQYAAIIANSQFMSEQAVLAGVPKQKLTVLPCFAEQMGSIETSLKHESRRIVFAGRLSKSKGVHYLLRAFALLRKRLPEARLDIAGSGIDGDFFVRLSNTLGLSEAVTFHGWCDRQEMDRLLEGSCVVAFPSIYPEAFGISGIEAMIHRKPVVAFDVGGVREWLRHGETGFLVEAKNIDAFALALQNLFKDRELHKRMSLRAREIALNNFSATHHVSRLTDIYERAIGLEDGVPISRNANCFHQ